VGIIQATQVTQGLLRDCLNSSGELAEPRVIGAWARAASLLMKNMERRLNEVEFNYRGNVSKVSHYTRSYHPHLGVQFTLVRAFTIVYFSARGHMGSAGEQAEVISCWNQVCCSLFSGVS